MEWVRWRKKDEIRSSLSFLIDIIVKADWDSCSSYHSLNEMNGWLGIGGEKKEVFCRRKLMVIYWWGEKKEEKKDGCCCRCFRKWKRIGRRKWGRMGEDIKLTRRVSTWGTKGVNRQERREKESDKREWNKRRSKMRRGKRGWHKIDLVSGIPWNGSYLRTCIKEEKKWDPQ